MFATFMVFLSCSPAMQGAMTTILLVTFVVFWGACTMFIAAPTMLRAARTFVAVDEGGVRCKIGSFSTYWPFSMTGAGSIEGGIVFVPVLVLRDRSERPFVRLPLIGAGSLRDGRALLAAYEARRTAQPPELPAVITHLDRRGRALGDWCTSIDAVLRAAERPGYRQIILDPQDLLVALADATLPADVRAGAAYALLHLGTPDAMETLRSLIRPESPPIVVRMFALGSGVTPPREQQDALDFLDAEDRADPEAAPRPPA